MKICFKCGIKKPAAEFYKHKKMADGRLGKCKECTKADTAAHRTANIEAVRAYDRARAKAPKRKAHIREVTIEWRKKRALAYKAQTAVGNAIRDGKLVKKPCAVCGSIKVHGHHEDYSKPLDVTWLCAAHHKQLHSKKENRHPSDGPRQEIPDHPGRD